MPMTSALSPKSSTSASTHRRELARTGVALTAGFVVDALAHATVVVIGRHQSRDWAEVRRRAKSVTSVGEAADDAATEGADMVVLNVDDRFIRPLGWLRSLRSRDRQGIVVVLARPDLLSTVLAFEMGADEVLCRPVDQRVVAARFNALARRCAIRGDVQSDVRRHGEIRLDERRHEVHVGARLVELTPTEWRLLVLLFASPGRVISRSEMIQKVWGQGADLDPRSVDPHIVHLRRKLRLEDSRIHSVPGIGYLL